MQNKDLINEENYQKVNKKLFKIQIILLIVWLLFVALGITLIVLAIKEIIWTIIPGIATISMSSMGIGATELMLYIVRHQRGIQAYQAQTAIPVVKEAVYETADIQKEFAKNVSEGFNEGKANYCFCTECGAKNFVDAKFCSSCGKEIKKI